jgi:arylformamidase
MSQPSAKWIDVSVTLRDGMVRWPDNPPVRITRTQSMDGGDDCNVTALSLGVHSGTHMDAPLHFLRKGRGIDAMPLPVSVGPARVIAIRNRESIKPDELREHRIRRGERILFKTRNSPRCWRSKTFLKDFVFLSEEGARWLAARQVCTVGIDYLSIAGFYSDSAAIHTTLLKAGIWIIEGLNLSKVQPGTYDLVCLPIKIAGGDGAPARALLRPVGNSKTGRDI